MWLLYAAVHCGHWCWHKGNNRGRLSDGTSPDPPTHHTGDFLNESNLALSASCKSQQAVTLISLSSPSTTFYFSHHLSPCSLSLFLPPSCGCTLTCPLRRRPSSKISSGLIGVMSIDGSEQETETLEIVSTLAFIDLIYRVEKKFLTCESEFVTWQVLFSCSHLISKHVSALQHDYVTAVYNWKSGMTRHIWMLFTLTWFREVG